MKSRRLTQVAAVFVANPWFPYFSTRLLYKGKPKGVCFPGMNCHSCPMAMYSCPIGGLQYSLAARSLGALLYVVGFMAAVGAAVGRLPCGWVCPFGFLQDILYKVPLPKLRLARWAGYLKYVSLGVLAVLLPLVVREHWFSRLCPVGTLEAGIPLQLLPPAGLPGAALDPGEFFWLKLAILVVFLFWMMVTKRPFCRTVCPLGAALSLFNPISLYRLEVDSGICRKCGKCRAVCPVDINVFDNPNAMECVRCLECKRACPLGAVSSGFRLWRGARGGAEEAA